jgi:hypothetical protein
LCLSSSSVILFGFGSELYLIKPAYRQREIINGHTMETNTEEIIKEVKAVLEAISTLKLKSPHYLSKYYTAIDN